MKTIVMKFGGTSVATGENIIQVANLIKNAAEKKFSIVVVVSALDGVTDELFEEAERSQKSKIQLTSKTKSMH